MINVPLATDLATQLEKRICVSKPYYALQNLHVISDNILQAEIETENLSHGEATIICGAEAGRHLAILGSCALALKNSLDTKHYYLANKAFITRGDNLEAITQIDSTSSHQLIVQANVLELDLAAKKGKVQTSIRTSSGELIFELEVSYQVLKADLFQKLFRRGFVENARTALHNPYTQTVHITITAYDEQVLSGDLGIISASQCVGHFDDYPALPIAILSGGLSKLAAMHLKLILKNKDLKFAIKKSSLAATRLAFAGEHVFVHSTYIESANGEYTFYAKATNLQNEELGEIEITFELLPHLMDTDSSAIHYFPTQQKASKSIAL